jgi:hypothetical protein
MRSNKRIESARFACPTRKERCSLLAAHSQRWAEMKTKLVSAVSVTLGLLMLVSSSYVVAQESGSPCTTFKRDRFNGFFSLLRSQTVFGSAGLVGWRVYGPPEALQRSGLSPRDLVTHFCGVSLRSIVETQGDICCQTEGQDKVALTVVRDGESMRVMAQLLPNKPLRPIAPKRAPAEQ